MADNVTPIGFVGSPKNTAGLRHYLVCHKCHSIVLVHELEQFVHMPVQLLLPCCKGPPACIFSPEMGGEGINDKQSGPALSAVSHLRCTFTCRIHEKHLVI